MRDVRGDPPGTCRLRRDRDAGGRRASVDGTFRVTWYRRRSSRSSPPGPRTGRGASRGRRGSPASAGRCRAAPDRRGSRTDRSSPAARSRTRIEIVASPSCRTGESRTTGSAVQSLESAPAAPPCMSVTTIARAPQPFTPFDQRRSQIVESGSTSRFVNVMDSSPRHECPSASPRSETTYAGEPGLRMIVVARAAAIEGSTRSAKRSEIGSSGRSHLIASSLLTRWRTPGASRWGKLARLGFADVSALKPACGWVRPRSEHVSDGCQSAQASRSRRASRAVRGAIPRGR